MIICGIITEPIAAVSATDEPEMQPNMVEARMLTSARPPRRKPTKTFARLTRREAMPPSAMMPPARMKNGIASSAKSSMPSEVFSMTASSGKIDPERGEDRGDAERIGDRHAEQAEDREAADENENVHGGPYSVLVAC